VGHSARTTLAGAGIITRVLGQQWTLRHEPYASTSDAGYRRLGIFVSDNRHPMGSAPVQVAVFVGPLGKTGRVMLLEAAHTSDPALDPAMVLFKSIVGQAKTAGSVGPEPTGGRLPPGQCVLAGPAGFGPVLKYRAGLAVRLLACATIWLAVVMAS